MSFDGFVWYSIPSAVTLAIISSGWTSSSGNESLSEEEVTSQVVMRVKSGNPIENRTSSFPSRANGVSASCLSSMKVGDWIR